MEAYDGSFNIDPNGKYVVYARVVDKVGNFAIYNSNGLVLDSIAPKLSVNDGDVYCGEVTITVTEDNFDYLTVDGNRVDLTDGQFKLTDKETAQKIEVFDTEDSLMKKYKVPKQISGYEYEGQAAAKAIREGVLECPEIPQSQIIHMMELMDTIRHKWGFWYPGEEK